MALNMTRTIDNPKPLGPKSRSLCFFRVPAVFREAELADDAFDYERVAYDEV